MDELKDFPVRVTWPVAWGEMDAMGHLNNIYYFRFFETIRIRYLEEAGLMPLMAETGIGPILAETTCRFRRPVQYPDEVTVGGRVISISRHSFTMEYVLVSAKAGVAATGEGIVVAFDYRNGKKAEVPPRLREALESMEGKKL